MGRSACVQWAPQAVEVPTNKGRGMSILARQQRSCNANLKLYRDVAVQHLQSMDTRTLRFLVQHHKAGSVKQHWAFKFEVKSSAGKIFPAGRTGGHCIWRSRRLIFILGCCILRLILLSSSAEPQLRVARSLCQQHVLPKTISQTLRSRMPKALAFKLGMFWFEVRELCHVTPDP